MNYLYDNGDIQRPSLKRWGTRTGGTRYGCDYEGLPLEPEAQGGGRRTDPHAAAQTGQTVSDFLTASAIERAHDVLADQHSFVLDEARWDQFVALLDEPERPAPRLVELFARPQRITR